MLKDKQFHSQDGGKDDCRGLWENVLERRVARCETSAGISTEHFTGVVTRARLIKEFRGGF